MTEIVVLKDRLNAKSQVPLTF